MSSTSDAARAAASGAAGPAVFPASGDASSNAMDAADARTRALPNDPRALLKHLYRVAVDRALPGKILAGHLPPPPRGRTLVIGAGKGGGSMAQAMEAAWPASAPMSGLVITRYGHIPPDYQPRRIEMVEAAHPVPDAAGERAAARMMQLVRDFRPTADDQVICLISGGGSALMPLPAPGLTLADKQAVNRALLASGANIAEMNCVRKHLSAIKGGRLAAACAPAKVLTLMISDVPGDDPQVIASGPTVPDATTCADALAICRRYRIALPPQAVEALERGDWETPKPGDACFDGHEQRIIAAPRQSLLAAAEAARALGLTAHVLSDEIEGVMRHGAEGVGLYRTEMHFLDRKELPDEEEQAAHYSAVAKRAGELGVIIRTLDVGGDKLAAGDDWSAEENPFLGWRGIEVIGIVGIQCVAKRSYFFERRHGVGIFLLRQVRFPQQAQCSAFGGAAFVAGGSIFGR